MELTGSSLSGLWNGHFVNFFDFRTGEPDAVADHEFPIQARVVVRDGRFRGTMMDLVTERSYPYWMIVEGIAGKKMGVKELMEAKKLLQQSPSLHVDSKYPSASTLAGRVSGNVVTFTKTYEGPVRVDWRMDNGAVYHHVKQKHQVIYRGTLTDGGTVLSGTWVILKPGLAGFFGAKAVEGTFQLRHEAEVD